MLHQAPAGGRAGVLANGQLHHGYKQSGDLSHRNTTLVAMYLRKADVSSQPTGEEE
jgi:hypothetical protein